MKFWDAWEARDAVDSYRRITLEPGRSPRTIAGETVVFTGKIPGMTRVEAAEAARTLGAAVQENLTDQTTMLVVGKLNGGGLSPNADVKLFDARERIRLDQALKIVSARQIMRLIGAATPT